MVRVFFDGVLVENPKEWRELSVSIVFDHENQITSIEYGTNLNFFKGGYEYLYNKRLTSCELVSVRIEKDCNGCIETIIRGFIFVTDCTFNELECSVQTIIQDDGFSSRIQNNKSTVVSLSSQETKNGGVIIAANERIVTTFDPSTGNYENVVRGYTVFETFKFIVSWMSDNTVDFKSDYFETGDGKDDWLCSGIDLRSRAVASDLERVNPVSTSFEDLFTLMRRILNVAVGFQRSNNGAPIMRIEPLSFFRNSSVILNLENVNKTELSFVKELLYANIKIGSDIIQPSDCNNGNGFCSSENFISYYGFDNEQYSISGECNQNIDLDLSVDSKFVIDTNTIQDVLFFDNDSFDKKTFLISTFENNPNSYRAVQTDVFDLGSYWYNARYTNKEILLRYVEYLSGNILLFGLYNGINLFRAEAGTPSSILFPLQTPSYQTDPVVINFSIYDPFSRFDGSDGRFTPVDEGFYSFCVGTMVDDAPSTASAVIVFTKLVIEKYDLSGVLLNRYESDVREFITPLATANYEEWVSPYIPMNGGDYCIFVVDYAQGNNPGVTPGQSEIRVGGSNFQYFSCCASRVAIQDIQANTGQDRRVTKTSFNYPIPWQEFKGYLNDTTKLIGLSNQRINRVGWNNEITHNFITGETELSILSNDV